MRWKRIVTIVVAAFAALLVVVYIIAASYDYNKLKPMITDAVKNFTGRDLTVGGDVDLTIGFPPSLEVADIAFQNASWGSEPQMARLKKLRVQVAVLPLLKGNLKINNLLLVEPVFLLETGKSGQSNLDFDVPTKAEAPRAESKTGGQSQTRFALEEIELKDGRIAYKDHRSGQTEIVELTALDLKKPLFGDGADIDIKGSYNKAPFELSGNIGLLSALKTEKKWPLKIEARAVKTIISAEGSIQDPTAARGIDLKLNVEGEDLAEIGKLTGKSLAVKGPFKLSGHLVSPTDREVAVSDLLVVLGESRIQGKLKFTRTAKRPHIEAILTAEKLDLRPLLAADKPADDGQPAAGARKQPAAAGSTEDKVFPGTPLKADALLLVDATAQLKAARILTPRLAFDDFLVDLALKDGVLNVKQLKAGGEKGGKLTATMKMAAQKSGAKLNLKLDIEELDLGNMAKNLGAADAVAGRLNMELDLHGQGDSVAALMAGLNGSTKVLVSEGRINNRYADLIGGDLRASINELFNPLAEKKEFATLNCLVNQFDIEDGLAQSRILVIDTNRMTVIGDGDIDLKTEQLDLGVVPDPKEGLGASNVATVNISLSEFAKPFRLKGTLAHPSLGIDPAKTALTFGRTLGGIVLFGPAGATTSLVSGKFGQNHPCAKALAAVDDTAKKAPKKKSGGILDKVKNFFNKPKN